MRLRKRPGKQELNTNEYKVLKAMVKQALDETGGEFGYTDHIRVSNLSKHEVAGYISALKKKGYIEIFEGDETYNFNQFYLKKKAEEVFDNVKVYQYSFVINK